ncbi:MAG TPA: dTMP kinase [Tepidisphaeraceae bacterium]|jgi:dTMP kinase
MSSPPSSPGLFIVLDGPEGSGKSTQLGLLRQKLDSAGRPVLVVRDPGATRIGEEIRSILLNPRNDEMAMRCEMLLYMAARAQMMSETILPALAAGQTVISDRFVSSTLAYQLGGDGLTAADIRAVADIAIRHRWPDLTLLLDLPVDVSSARVKPKYLLPFPASVQDAAAQAVKDRIEQRPRLYHEQVRRNYLAQASADPQHYRVINADRPAEAVHNDIWSAVSPFLK